MIEIKINNKIFIVKDTRELFSIENEAFYREFSILRDKHNFFIIHYKSLYGTITDAYYKVRKKSFMDYYSNIFELYILEHWGYNKKRKNYYLIQNDLKSYLNLTSEIENENNITLEFLDYNYIIKLSYRFYALKAIIQKR